MFLLPVLAFWVLALALAGRAWRVRRRLPPASSWRTVLLGIAGLLVGFVLWSLALLVTTDSLW
jgi:hypothetical protein